MWGGGMQRFHPAWWPPRCDVGDPQHQGGNSLPGTLKLKGGRRFPRGLLGRGCLRSPSPSPHKQGRRGTFSPTRLCITSPQGEPQHILLGGGGPGQPPATAMPRALGCVLGSRGSLGSGDRGELRTKIQARLQKGTWTSGSRVCVAAKWSQAGRQRG